MYLTHIELIYTNLLNNSVLFEYAPCLVHNDFSSDNMIFKNNRLFGVIDLGDFIVGDIPSDKSVSECTFENKKTILFRKIFEVEGINITS